MSDYYVHEKIRELCIKKNWFTCGNNDQYEKLMVMSTSKYPSTTYTLRDLAIVIWICSEDASLREIETELENLKRELAC